ncbi:hypothetical protein OG266_22670 [Streptomyces sp. NBC_00554]|uniref:hypothetical protein n=1 Tax=unclassified Streptomyces TaxID=2593676 RepID=UPI00224D2425|nr:hypothetical protein [Streptomyces sp. NBC_00620]MCX4973122.1 hypothetical protein [Streptomyces sp. NBC_00620]WUC51051.1 hypothetical protein OG266_22670 [Streptomyces sp. NBC_00554]
MNLRLLALAGVVAVTVALPLAVASAGPVGDADPADVRASGRSQDSGHSQHSEDAGLSDGAGHSAGSADSTDSADSEDGNDKGPAADPARSPLLLGLGLATAARCGPELSSPDGIEAQTCVLTQGEETWARTYYRNATGDELSSVLSLMEPGGRTVLMRCAVGAEDDPGACETPRGRTTGDVGAYAAVAEFAKGGEDGPLLLRSGSNSAP